MNEEWEIIRYFDRASSENRFLASRALLKQEIVLVKAGLIGKPIPAEELANVDVTTYFVPGSAVSSSPPNPMGTDPTPSATTVQTSPADSSSQQPSESNHLVRRRFQFGETSHSPFSALPSRWRVSSLPEALEESPVRACFESPSTSSAYQQSIASPILSLTSTSAPAGEQFEVKTVPVPESTDVPQFVDTSPFVSFEDCIASSKHYCLLFALLVEILSQLLR